MSTIDIPASSEEPGPSPRFRKNAVPNRGNTLAMEDLWGNDELSTICLEKSGL